MVINKDRKEDLLLFVKILIFAYIVSSPFISHSWLTFINYTPIKIILSPPNFESDFTILSFI